RIVDWNLAAQKMFGHSREEALGQPLHQLIAPPRYHADAARGFAHFEETGDGPLIGQTSEVAALRKDGSEFTIELSISPIKAQGCWYAMGIIRDITERKRQTERTAALLELSTSVENLDEKTLLQRGLDTVQHLTDSRIGFLHFVSEDQSEIELVTWSNDTLAHYCQAAFDRHYPVSAAGIWADCIRLKQAVIINDYAAAPDKKGLPEGHSDLQRFISVPVFEGAQVRMIVGVGNAARDYDEHDVETVKLFSYDLYRIIQRKRTEQTLQESESKYRRLIENSPDIVYTYSVTRGGMYYSAQVITILGYSVEHLYAHPFLWNESIHPEDRAVVAKAIEEFKAGSPFKIEYRIKNAHGGWRWFYDRSIGGREENGDSIIEGMAMDITERKQIEAVLKFLAESGYKHRKENFFQALAEFLAQTMAMDYVCIDRLEGDNLTARTLAIYFDGKFEDNASYTLKDTPCGDVVAKKVCCFTKDVRHLFPQDAVLQEMLAESYAGTTLFDFDGKPIGLIAVIGRKPLANTHLAEALLQMVAVRAAAELERQRAEDKLQGMLKEANQSRLVMLDVVEDQRRAEESLRQLNAELENKVLARTTSLEQARHDAEAANQAKSDFLATMSHEIRTPMNGVVGMLDVLQQSSLNGKQMEMANIIHDSAYSLLAIVNDILDFSKIEAGKLQIDSVPMSVADVV
ncbi:MAG: PAS domain S-box protein, partial [Sideroxyarcus sp.]|nr:PAS domain S-box protein [Sideroxyarcus sp.]